ncbi:MAG: hypothetical protein JKY54_06600 [Flavobacteriales bacterium]|nr:hypothetical protein [Flavobacteriales bacterium]
MVVKRVFALFILLFPIFIGAQNPLQKKISIKVQSLPVETILVQIEDQAGFYFSYNINHIDLDRTVTLNLQNVPVQSVLSNLFGSTLEFKHRGNYVIIQKAKPEPGKKDKYLLAGEITDKTTGKKIADVTIYEVKKLKSAISNEEGKFDLKVSDDQGYVDLLISKKNYRDTLIRISSESPPLIQITLKPEVAAPTQQLESKIDSLGVIRFFLNKHILNNIQNVILSEERDFQISFLPFAGTNRRMSGKVTNKISINVLAGYSYGLNGFEVGGLVNMVRDSAIGLQMAGLGNFVGGEIKATQLAGLFNIGKSKFSGVQIAGLGNFVGGEVKATQLAGLFNIGKSKFSGVQIAGLANIVSDTVEGAQIAGLINLAADTITGIQIAGLANFTSGTIEGAQFSGLANFAKTVKGSQVTGLLNYTKKLNGLQIGFINIADTVEKGLTLGFFNYVKSGFHQFEISGSDYMHGNLSFKTGTHQFYSIFTGGYYHNENKPLWSYGYGFGTQINMGKRFYANIEATSQQINPTVAWEDGLNLLNDLAINFGINIGKMSINAGPVIHTNVSTLYHADTDTWGYFQPANTQYRSTSQTSDVKIWIGYRAAIRF